MGAILRPLALGLALATTGCSTLIGADFDVGPEVLAEGLAYPKGLAVDGGVVFVAVSGNGGDGRVIRVDAAGNVVDLKPPGGVPDQISVGGDYVYWTDFEGQGGVFRTRKSGGGPVESIAGVRNSPIGVIADDSAVYWTENGSMLLSLPLSEIGTGTPTVLADKRNVPSLLIRDGDTLFFTEFGAPGGVSSVPVKGGPTTALATGFMNSPDLVKIGDEIFFTTVGASGGEIAQTAPSGGQSDFVKGQSDPASIETDGVYMYWTNFSDGRVMKISPGSGTPIVIAHGQESPNGIAVDGEFVYWANDSPMGTVNRRRK